MKFYCTWDWKEFGFGITYDSSFTILTINLAFLCLEFDFYKQYRTETEPTETENSKAEGMEIVLEGKVFLEETDKDGKVISKEEIDGDVILKLILLNIEEAIKNMSNMSEEEIKQLKEEINR